jgi:GMP synthase (glutamine-hydrolysing)
LTLLIINNYSEKNDLERIVKIEQALKKAGADNIEVLDFSEIQAEKPQENIEAIVLSGSGDSLRETSNLKKFTAEIELVKKAKVPILGICFGHQLIGVAFGSTLDSLKEYITDFNEIQITQNDLIFSPWKTGDNLVVKQNHIDCLKSVPKDFVLLATSQTCEIEAIRHKKLQVFGFQAHIERYSDAHMEGFRFIQNFVCKIMHSKE